MLKLALFVTILGVFLQQAYQETEIRFLFNDFFLVCFEEREDWSNLFGKEFVNQFCQQFKNLRKDVKRCRVVDDVRLDENNTYATHISDSCGVRKDIRLHPEFASRNDCLITKMEDPFFSMPIIGFFVSNVRIYCDSNDMGKIWGCFKVAEATKSENLPSDMVDPISEAAESYYRQKCETEASTEASTEATGGASVNEMFSFTLLLGVLSVIMT